MADTEEHATFLKLLGKPVDSFSKCFTIYIPNKDRYNRDIEDINDYIDTTGRILIELNGGVTVLDDMQGGWRDDDTDIIINERTAIVYSFLTKEADFVKWLFQSDGIHQRIAE